LDYPSKISGSAYSSNQFCILRGELQTIIVKPSEFKFMTLNNEVFGIDYISVIDSISDDQLFFTSPGSSFDNIEHYNIDLNTTWKKHANKAHSFNLKPVEKVNSIAFNTWFIVSIILLLTTVFVYFVMKHSQAKQNTIIMDAVQPDMIKEASIQTQTTFQTVTLAETLPDAQTEIEDETQVVIEEEIQLDIEENLSDSLYRVLLQSEKTFFSGDELDEIFGISHLEPDSKKSKRHRYLANLDKNHPGFVVRVKEQIDKRRFNYKIVK